MVQGWSAKQIFDSQPWQEARQVVRKGGSLSESLFHQLAAVLQRYAAGKELAPTSVHSERQNARAVAAAMAIVIAANTLDPGTLAVLFGQHGHNYSVTQETPGAQQAASSAKAGLGDVVNKIADDVR